MKRTLASYVGNRYVAIQRYRGGEAPRICTDPAGTFEMGDHHGFVDPKHGGDETRSTRSAWIRSYGDQRCDDEGVL